jgi:hypothetical protein
MLSTKEIYDNVVKAEEETTGQKAIKARIVCAHAGCGVGEYITVEHR